MNTYSNITSIVRTTGERALLRDELRLLLTSVFETKKETLEEVLNSQVRASTSEIVRENLAMKVDPQKFFEDALSDLEKLEVLHLTTAVEPTEHVLIRIVDWVRKNVGEHIILSFDYNPALVGGAIIAFRGRYKDISLRNAVADVLDQDKDKIIEKLRVQK